MNEIEKKVSVIAKVMAKDGDIRFDEYGFMEYSEEYGWLRIPIADVKDVDELVMAYEDLVFELSEKEMELAQMKEEYNRKEFDIIFRSDIDFKSLYGSTSEKVRKQHAKETLAGLDKTKSDLELSVEFIKNYIPLLREVIRSKRE